MIVAGDDPEPDAWSDSAVSVVGSSPVAALDGEAEVITDADVIGLDTEDGADAAEDGAALDGGEIVPVGVVDESAPLLHAAE